MDRHHKHVLRLVIHLAMEDPSEVKRVIRDLEKNGEIDPGDLDYLVRLAEKWERIGRSRR